MSIQMGDMAIASRVGQYNSQQEVVLSAIAALMNSSDGSLEVALSDNAAINDQQINCRPQLFDKDEFQQQLTTLVRFWLGEEYLPLLKVRMTTVEGKTVGIVEVKKSPTLVFIKNSQSRVFFKIRQGETTRDQESISS